MFASGAFFFWHEKNRYHEAGSAHTCAFSVIAVFFFLMSSAQPTQATVAFWSHERKGATQVTAVTFTRSSRFTVAKAIDFFAVTTRRNQTDPIFL